MGGDSGRIAQIKKHPYKYASLSAVSQPKIMYFLQQTVNILLLSLVSAHCGQIVEDGKLTAVNGQAMPKSNADGMVAFGLSNAIRFARPLGDWRAPTRYLGKRPTEAYALMIQEGQSVRELFNEVTETEQLVLPWDKPRDGYTNDTCGYYDPNFEVVLADDATPQSTSTGSNHNGPSEIWIDDVRTHHTSNLLASEPEVLSRDKYNCDKDFCLYKWYWIVFRSDQHNNDSGASFQMWVQCARIKGNGKVPVPVVPVGNWRDDPRPNVNIIPVNKPNLKVTPNPDEKVVSGSSSTNSTIAATILPAAGQSSGAVSSSRSTRKSAAGSVNSGANSGKKRKHRS
jgi:hypothetical protein